MTVGSSINTVNVNVIIRNCTFSNLYFNGGGSFV